MIDGSTAGSGLRPASAKAAATEILQRIDLVEASNAQIERDITERGRTVESVITQYLDVVRPGHLEFVEPTKTYADLIIPEGGNNEKALQVLTSLMQGIG
mgnify:CR=1 FL=1